MDELDLGEELLNLELPQNSVKHSFNPVTLWENLGLTLTGNNKPHANMDNVVRILERYEPFKDLLWYDTFHGKFFTRWQSDTIREWYDNDCLILTKYIQEHIELHSITDSIVEKACRLYGNKQAKNEPQEWMEALKWDGVERLPSFMSDALGANEDNYIRSVSQNFWIAMVARVYKPGCKYDNMIVLEGRQGAFKSTALKVIGGKWFTEINESVQNKDFYIGLQGKLLIEIAELDAFSKAETSRIKQVISNPSDRYRAPYDRVAQDKARTCIFVGTTNEGQYLKDNTGGRRFWPVKVGQIRLDIITASRDQYFAEAVAKYKQGVTWWAVPEQAIEEQEMRRQGDEWEAIIAQYVQGYSEITITDVLSGALKIEPSMQGKIEQMRAAHALRLIRWERTRYRKNGVQMAVWKAPEEEL